VEFLRIEGRLLSEDVLKRIIDGNIYGQSPKDFGVKRFTDEVASVWNLARELWSKFQKRSETLKEEDLGTTITRNLWIVPLLTELGYNPIYEPQAAEVSGVKVKYNFSHRMDTSSDSPPLHIVGFRQDLDKKAPNSRFSPHATVQQYLNVSDHLWGLVTNGHKLRIVRATAKLTIPSYIEFDLKWIMEAEDFSAFIVFYRLVHRSRFPKGVSDAHECLLEKYHQESLEQGARIRDRLRDSVEEALKILGNGFLNHPLNEKLREAVSSGNVSPSCYYRELLRLIYCFLFIMVAEERKLIQPDDAVLKEIYDAGYGLSRIRELSRNPRIAQSEHYDFWEGVKRLIFLLSSEEGEKLRLTILNGGLFSWENFFFKDLFLSNRHLLEAIHHLSYFEKDGRLTRVNYAALDVEELGSVYESLLDYQPVFAHER